MHAHTGKEERMKEGESLDKLCAVLIVSALIW